MILVHRARSRRTRRKRKTGTSLNAQFTTPTKVLKLRFVSNPALFDGVAGKVSYNSIPINNAFANQPMGYDQWALFYNRYEVLSAKVTVQAISAGTGGTSQGILMVFPSKTDISASGTVDGLNEALQQPGAVWKPMGISSSGNDAPKVSKSLNLKKYFGQSVLDTDTGAAINASPNRLAFLNVGLGPIDPGDIMLSTRVTITIDYVIRFSDRQVLATS